MPRQAGDLPAYRPDQKPREHCHHCGAIVTTRGRPPKKLGVRYCSKPDCQAAKAAALRALKPKSETRAAPTNCTSCGDLLTPRPWRSEDAIGRFCRKQRCQRRRDEARSGVGDGVAELVEAHNRIEKLENTLRYIQHEALSPRVECPTCGLIDAVPDWLHFARDNESPCRGTQSEAFRGVPFNIVKAELILWPRGKRYADEFPKED